MKGSGKRGAYSHIAKEKNVPEGCSSNWWKNREKYYKTAAKKMNVRLMGVKARRLMEKRGKSFPSAGGVKHVNPLPTCDTKECVLKPDVYVPMESVVDEAPRLTPAELQKPRS